MKSSRRMKRLPAPYLPAFLSMAGRLADQGCDVIQLGHDTPDLPAPRHIAEALETSAGKRRFLSHDPLMEGPELREAVCGWYRTEHGVALDPDAEVAVVPGIRAGLIRLAAALLNPGDAALVPDPGPPEYRAGIALAGAAAMPMPLRKANAYLPELEAIPLSRRIRAKLMYLNYPSNPLGVCAPASFFDEAVRFALKHRIVIAHDFTYGAVGFDGRKPVSFLSRPGSKEAGVEWLSLSAGYGISGSQIGFAAGNRRVIRLLGILQQHISSGVPEALQDAAAAALRSSQECVREAVRIYESRRNALLRDMDRIGWHAAPSEGSLFAWLPVPSGYSAYSFANLLLRKALVAAAPGNAFGEFGEGHVRLGLLTGEERLREAMRRIGALSVF